MTRESILRWLPWALAVFIAVVFVQSLFFKFSDSFETRHIFGVIGEWMGDVGFPEGMAAAFAAWGGYAVGSAELLASLMLLLRRTQSYGAALAFAIISGAIFFHLFTPLGVSVVVNEAGDRDGGQLFALAVLVWFSALGIGWLRRRDPRPASGPGPGARGDMS